MTTPHTFQSILVTVLHTHSSYTAIARNQKLRTKVVPSLRFVNTLHTAQSILVTLPHTRPTYTEIAKHHTKVVPSLRFVNTRHTAQSNLVTLPHTPTIIHCYCEKSSRQTEQKAEGTEGRTSAGMAEHHGRRDGHDGGWRESFGSDRMAEAEAEAEGTG